MSEAAAENAEPRVAAILVVHDGSAWLPAALDSLERQDYPNLHLVAVDNGSGDGSHDILREHLPADDIVSLVHSVGFGQAVAAATEHSAVASADHLLLLHDDLALMPGAVTALVGAMAADDTLAVVGPKLREWSREPILQQVGMTIDHFGRAETGTERGELDQGHLDVARDTLYVSTAGMLVRTELFTGLGGFDERFPALGDDLDLCWRTWLAGWRIGVVPKAVGYHVAAGSRGGRVMWHERPAQVRYLSERHALATMAKNYALHRLAWVLPLTVLLAMLKGTAFLLTRRFSDANAVLGAYAWNVGQARATLKRRRRVQRFRRRKDAELRTLFATGLPRMRDHSDTVRDWLAGSGTPSMLDTADDRSRRPAASKVAQALRERPAHGIGLLLGVAYLVGLAPLLGEGQLLGGTVLPWPADSLALLQNYAGAASGEPLATRVSATPLQAVLGALGVLVLDNAWLAQRLAVLGLVPLAWLTTLRAGRLVTAARVPRVIGATLYVLSPVVLGTLAQARLGELVVAALLPALVLLTTRVVNVRTPRGQAWRAAAWLAVVAALAVSAAPGLWPVTVTVLAVGLGVALSVGTGRRAMPFARVAVSALAAAALLAPWLSDLLTFPGSALEPAPAAPLPAWRALALVPTTLPGMSGTGGYVLAAMTAAVLVLALLLGLRLRPLPVAGLVATIVLSAAAAWGSGQLGLETVWAPGLLLPGAAALAGLGVVMAHTLRPALGSQTFGVTQLVAVSAVLPLLAGLGLVSWLVATGPWEALDRDVELVPPFIGAESERIGPYRLLVLDDVGGEELQWAVTGANGPDLLDFASTHSPALTEAVDRGLSGILAADHGSGASLGLLGVRYVLLHDESPELTERLLAQPDLEPLSSGDGRIFRVRTWVPRAAVLPAEVTEEILATGSPGDMRAYEGNGLARTRPGVYEGAGPADATTLVVTEEPGLHTATAGGTSLPTLEGAVDIPLAAFGPLPPGDEITVSPDNPPERIMGLAVQATALLLLLSLLLRPPGSGREERHRLYSTATAESPTLEVPLEPEAPPEGPDEPEGPGEPGQPDHEDPYELPTGGADAEEVSR